MCSAGMHGKREADVCLLLKGHRDGHHHDRPAKRWQDVLIASTGGKHPNVPLAFCAELMHPRAESSQSSESLPNRPRGQVADILCFKLDPNSRLQHEASAKGPRDSQMVCLFSCVFKVRES